MGARSWWLDELEGWKGCIRPPLVWVCGAVALCLAFYACVSEGVDLMMHLSLAWWCRSA